LLVDGAAQRRPHAGVEPDGNRQRRSEPDDTELVEVGEWVRRAGGVQQCRIDAVGVHRS
jgi:hypothetical protein